MQVCRRGCEKWDKFYLNLNEHWTLVIGPPATTSSLCSQGGLPVATARVVGLHIPLVLSRDQSAANGVGGVSYELVCDTCHDKVQLFHCPTLGCKLSGKEVADQNCSFFFFCLLWLLCLGPTFGVFKRCIHKRPTVGQLHPVWDEWLDSFGQFPMRNAGPSCALLH